MRRLVLGVLVAVILAVILPVHGQEKGAPATSQQDHRQDNQKSATQPSPSTLSTQVNAIDQESSKPNCNGCSNHPNSYFARLFSPENLPNIALVIAGIGGI